MKKIILGGGCFWCIEAVFQRLKGVKEVVSGYCGGKRANPSYEQICTGATGHAEVVKIVYDEDIISLEEILEVFFAIHDPTTLNAQGADKGTQYRSIIFYANEEERKIIQNAITKAQQEFQDPIVTEVTSLQPFYKAEEYHQNYYNTHPHQGYCQVVIKPKVQKFLTHFSDKIV